MRRDAFDFGSMHSLSLNVNSTPKLREYLLFTCGLTPAQPLQGTPLNFSLHLTFPLHTIDLIKKVLKNEREGYKKQAI